MTDSIETSEGEAVEPTLGSIKIANISRSFVMCVDCGAGSDDSDTKPEKTCVEALDSRVESVELRRLQAENEELRELLKNLLDASSAYAKAQISAETASNNYTDSTPEFDKLTDAMVNLSVAEQKAHNFLDTAIAKQNGGEA